VEFDNVFDTSATASPMSLCSINFNMPNGGEIPATNLSDQQLSQSAIIVPDQQHCNRYFIFTVTGSNTVSGAVIHRMEFVAQLLI
jgi:hypothetical protein